MQFDYDKLRGKIIEKFGSNYRFAAAMGWSERTMSLKITGKRSWKQTEICLAISLLGLSDLDVTEYFFKTKVQRIEQNKKEIEDKC